MNEVPSLISNFNVYRSGNRLVGVTAEVTLPDLEYMTATMSGAGLAGETDIPVIGHFPAISMEIPFTVLYDDTFSLLAMNGEQLTLRGNVEQYDASTGQIIDKSMRIIIGGIPKGLKPGKMAVASTMDSSVSLEVTYLKIEVGGAEKLELDKFNYVYKVNGVDLLAAAKQNI